jgi:putative DNA primase/helicase
MKLPTFDDYVDRTPPSPRLRLVRCADVELRPIEWLWPGRFPLGKLSILAGEQGLGKSFLSIDMAARLSRGMPWPDRRDEANPVGSTVFIAAEDDLCDTMKPRLAASGADETKIHFVEAARDADGSERFFNVEQDVLALESHLEAIGDVQLVVIDPIMSYLGLRTNSYNDAEVRRALMPLVKLAQRRQVALLCIMHLKKGQEDSTIQRIGGSVAFSALARAVCMVGRDPDDRGMRVATWPKMNIARPAGSLRFEMMDGAAGSAFVAWDAEPCELTAADVLGGGGGGGGGSGVPRAESAGTPARDEARAVLFELLEDGPVRSSAVEETMAARGLSRTTVSRAKRELGVTSRKIDNEWHVTLPA